MFIRHHLHTSHGFISTADHAESLGANFYQIFLGSPQRYYSPRRLPKDLIELKNKLLTKNIKIVVHASFMLNFCNPIESKIHKEAVRLLSNDLLDSTLLGAIGVVVHMGKRLNLTEEQATRNYVSGIKKVLQATPCKSTIILETGAGQGSEICTFLHDLSRLYKMFTASERQRIKFCIDTCHVYAAGYDIGYPLYVDVFCALVEDLLGWGNVVCIHLNDSKKMAGAKKDQHADIGKGYIEIDGLKKFVKVCVNKDIPIVLETPCENGIRKIEQLNMIKSWFD